jgi:mannose/fructose/N-acetylgalactosamine-specific phosphotransferase system component IIC
MVEVLFLSFLASLFSLDVTAFGQFMISRPIVVAPIIGFLLGDIKTGLWAGMILELIWVNVIPMGAAIPPDTTAVAVLTTVWSITTFAGQRGAVVLCLLLAVPAGILFRQVDIALRNYNVQVMHWIEQGVAAGREQRINHGIMIGIALFFVKAFVFYIVFIFAGQWVIRTIFPLLSERVIAGLAFAWRMLPVMGLAMLFMTFSNGFPCTKRNHK